jgi:uncharacterized protein YjbJ (UPF0337 family)
MDHEDKVRHGVQDATGKAKEAIGHATGDERLEAEGERDQSKADLGKAADKVKDAFKH